VSKNLRRGMLGLLSTLLVGVIVSPVSFAEAASQPVRQTRGPAVAPIPVVDYTISVKTSDVADAGTDSDVSLKLCGTNVCTRARDIDNPGDDRERGKTDVYNKTWEDVGTVNRVCIYMEAGSDWHLEWIHVKYGDQEVKFAYDGWVPEEIELCLDA
jgi:hypothetical protein